MSLAIFDLDNTLIADDSDYLWGQFLVDNGHVDAQYYAKENARFYEQYKQGNLDILEFLQFSLKPLADNDTDKLYQWREQFIEQIISPILLPAAQQLINKHRDRGDTLLVITATNRFVTEPIVNGYGIQHLLASSPEFINGRYTGKVTGVPCFQHGKVTNLEHWLLQTGETLEDSWFYSDSHNDLPLLNLVTHPIAVNPDEKLADIAKQRNWAIISLRDALCPTEHFHQ
jgi:HAD superfamily hydrolase (TIGR01490 family)